MIMKSEIKTEEEEEENNHGIQQRHEKNVPDKLGPVSNPSLPISSLPSVSRVQRDLAWKACVAFSFD
jgi:hypothetical protein